MDRKTDGIQKTVVLGLRELADKVETGTYGKDDDAFTGDEDELGHAFLSDMHDLVIDKME